MELLTQFYKDFDQATKSLMREQLLNHKHDFSSLKKKIRDIKKEREVLKFEIADILVGKY